MLKIYTAPGACSTACHIALQESGVPFESKLISFENGDADTPAFMKMNPKGYVPVLEIENGKYLTEGAAILQYIAELAPEKNLMPTKGFEKFKAQEWLNYVATEIHKGSFTPLFMAERIFEGPSFDQAREQFVKTTEKALSQRLDYVNASLEGKNFLLGNQFTVADAYLFTVLSWSKYIEFDLSSWKNIVNFQNRVYERPATQRAFKAEGLLS